MNNISDSEIKMKIKSQTDRKDWRLNISFEVKLAYDYENWNESN